MKLLVELIVLIQFWGICIKSGLQIYNQLKWTMQSFSTDGTVDLWLVWINCVGLNLRAHASGTIKQCRGNNSWNIFCFGYNVDVLAYASEHIILKSVCLRTPYIHSRCLKGFACPSLPTHAFLWSLGLSTTILSLRILRTLQLLPPYLHKRFWNLRLSTPYIHIRSLKFCAYQLLSLNASLIVLK